MIFTIQSGSLSGWITINRRLSVFNMFMLVYPSIHKFRSHGDLMDGPAYHRVMTMTSQSIPIAGVCPARPNRRKSPLITYIPYYIEMPFVFMLLYFFLMLQ